ncbi:GNAT family N-acetyltransferase [Plectonema cf. radiosum LEGE 06105]|uniref:GNAT family N-acetyltransferase n=1 Tax=Plectonema cf. radiosum LEGE 06105 TaxID=945769 RepID=A0A8J7JWT1_9CYAN|nr:GNAT family N-acetyltransferase [Plectonema radiosum]MBE9215965.1 GNAT family N-acetyltransferase [Plectonema cf. radiosum LEGE 06105]
MELQQPYIVTKRLLLRLANQEDVPLIIKYYTDNQAYLTPFYAIWPESFFTEAYWNSEVERGISEFLQGQSLRLLIFSQTESRIIGTINFGTFIRSIAQFCTVGYSLAEKEQGKGYMTEALQASIDYVFNELKMHRIMANYMPHNQSSGNLLKRLGFVVEGYARDYLLINGQWQDHILTSLINPKWEA